MPNDNKPGAVTEPLYEVLIDTWGAEPLHHKGDLISATDTPYDVAWGAQIGAIRELSAEEAAVIRKSGSASTTKPLTPSGAVDEDVQKGARDAAGAAQPAGTPPGPNAAGARQP